MNITNKYNLPDALVRALENDPYDNGGARRSVTQLLTPPRITMLRKQHHREMTADITDRVWLLLGSGLHAFLERGTAGKGAEERFFAKVNGWLISGAADLQIEDDGCTILDWKCTSVWSYVYDPDGKSDWVNQLNMLAWLARMNGREINKLGIVAIFRDWKAKDAQGDLRYPISPIMMIDIPLWSQEAQQDYVVERVRLHQEAEMLSTLGDDLPHCTPEDRWQKPDKFYAVKAGGKRGKTFDTVAEAEEYAGPGDITIGVRPSEPKRCGYCQVEKWCSQRQMELKSGDQSLDTRDSMQ